jgi:hypothetical protein
VIHVGSETRSQSPPGVWEQQGSIQAVDREMTQILGGGNTLCS